MKKTVLRRLLSFWMAMLTVLLLMAGTTVPAVAASECEAVIVHADQSTKEFATFAQAWNALASGDTLKLLKNVVLDGSDKTENARSTSLDALTVDGNGFTLSIPRTDAATGMYLDPAFLFGGDNLKIKDLKLDCGYEIKPLRLSGSSNAYFENLQIMTTGNYAIEVINTSLTLKNCYVSTTTVDVSMTAGATVEVIGGYYTTSQKGSNWGTLFRQAADTTLRIYGGYFCDDSANRALIMNSGVTEIYGGSFITGAASVFNKDANGSLRLVGANLITLNANATLVAGGCTDVTADGVVYSSVAGDASAKQHTAPNGVALYTTCERQIPTVRQGAGVRMITGSSGIRFQSDLSAELIAWARSKVGQDNVSYGTVIIPSEFLRTLYAFNMDVLQAGGIQYEDIPATAAGTTQNADGSVTISAALIDLYEHNYARDFSAVSYLKLVKDGQAFYIYAAYDANDNSRSIYDVAQMALADTAAGYTAAQREVLTMYLQVSEPYFATGILGKDPTKYSIVLSADASYAEQRFARRLQALYQARRGVLLPIVYDNEAGSDYEILIGNTARTTETVAKEQFRITVAGKRAEILADSVYGYEYCYEYCKTELLGLLADARENAGRLIATDTKPLMDADDISAVYNRTGALRMMNFNALGFGADPLKLRNEMIYEMIQTISPDIITLQELIARNRLEENAALHLQLTANGYAEAYTGTVIYDNGTVSPSGIFYRTELFEKVDAGYLELRTANRNDNIATWAVLREKATGRKLAVVCMHLYSVQDENSNAERLQQTEKLIELAKELERQHSCAVILAGDMNCNVESDPHRLFMQNGFVDLSMEAENGDLGPSNYSTDPTYREDIGVFERDNTNVNALAIDHMLAIGNGVEYKQYDVLQDLCSGATSDHMPIVLDFNLGDYELWSKNY